MEVYTMANGKFLPLGERKYLSMKDMAGRQVPQVPHRDLHRN